MKPDTPVLAIAILVLFGALLAVHFAVTAAMHDATPDRMYIVTEYWAGQ